MSGKSEHTMALDLPALESWLWEAACAIRGPIDAPKFKDYILPLIFLKRLSDVFDDEVRNLAEEFSSEEKARGIVEKDHKLVRFFIPKRSRWSEIARRTTGLGEYLTDAVRAVARENPRLGGVIDVTDFNATTSGQRILDDDRLTTLVGVLNQHRLGLHDVEPDLFGQAYEYLLRKFAEGSGSSAGEFFTPPEVAQLMACVLDPEPGQTVYDPCCGSGGLLIKAHVRLVEKYGKKQNGSLRLPAKVAPLRLFGQDIGPEKFAMTRMNAVIHDMEAEVALGDTMHRPAFTEADGSLRRFDLVTANPMWNQKFPASTYENDGYGRFTRGIPPNSSADWGWVQHMATSLKNTGKLAVVIDIGAVSRGSGSQGSSKERDIRKAFIEADLVEAVFLLPENLFYNMTAPGVILVINRKKRHAGEILVVNATRQFSKGKPKNILAADHVSLLSSSYFEWCSEPGLSRIISIAEAARHDYSLAPGLYVSVGGPVDALPFDDAVVAVGEVDEEVSLADGALQFALATVRVYTGGTKQTDVGDVPEHWEVITIGGLESLGCLWIRNGYAEGGFNENGDGVPHLRPFNVTEEGRISLRQVKSVAPPAPNDDRWVHRGDVIFNNTNSEDLVGKTALFDLDIACVLSNHMTIVRVTNPHRVDAQWLAFVLHRKWMDGEARAICRRHVNQASVGLERLRNVSLALPPIEEQRAIADRLRTIERAQVMSEDRAAALGRVMQSAMRDLLSGRRHAALEVKTDEPRS